MGSFWRALAISAVALAAAGCGGSDPAPPLDDGGPVAVGPPQSEHELAHRCLAMLADGVHVTRDGTALTTAGGSAENAEKFYLQPAGLARYAFYTADRKYVTAGPGAGTIGLSDAPAAGSDWTVAMPSTGTFNASTQGEAMTVADDGALGAGAAAAALTFQVAEGCTKYPEMPLNIGATYTGPAAGQPVIGFAEIHAHMSMGSDMSDGSDLDDGTRDRGPSAGGVMYGQAINRFGVVEALKDCSAMHGEEGERSPEWAVLDAGEPDEEPPEHDTQGWPTFVDWPAADSQLHQQMYWRFVERTYRAGLRLMVVHGTNIEALCDVAKKSGGDRNAECRDMEVGLMQVAYLKDMQDYIDAQNGGPGKGWFRIVKDPGEARQVIAQGKLAVVPGLEFSNVFHCNLTYRPDGTETHGDGENLCTPAEIDQEIEDAWNAGVRGMFPFHDVDSALGGTGIFSSSLNYVNYYGTKGYWKTYDCPAGGDDPDFYLFDAGALMYHRNEPEGFGSDPFTQTLMAAQGTMPVYKSGVRQCNAREVTPIGEYAIKAMLKKGFVLDIDHGSLKMKDYILSLADDTTPAYPTISAHGGHGGITWEQARQMVNEGGIIYPDMKNGREWKEFIDKVATIWPADRPLAVGYGADQNGLADQPTPRKVPRTDVTYPFTLFSGPGWSNMYAAAGIAPVQVGLLKVEESGRFWNIDEVGVAHYGMVPDAIAELVIEANGDTRYTDALYNSAEAYLRLWEQTLQASALRPAPTPP